MRAGLGLQYGNHTALLSKIDLSTTKIFCDVGGANGHLNRFNGTACTDLTSGLGFGGGVAINAIRWNGSVWYIGGDNGQWRVMVVRNGITAMQPVKLGLMNEDSAQIVEGLTPTDAVVARPSREIVEGMRVKTMGNVE